MTRRLIDKLYPVGSAWRSQDLYKLPRRYRQAPYRHVTLLNVRVGYNYQMETVTTVTLLDDYTDQRTYMLMPAFQQLFVRDR